MLTEPTRSSRDFTRKHEDNIKQMKAALRARGIRSLNSRKAMKLREAAAVSSVAVG